MRNWKIPGQWDSQVEAPKRDAKPETPVTLPVSPMRRQPLRKSGGFLQIDNIFAELDEEIAAARD